MTTKITGYKELSEEQIALMNDIKAKGNEIGVIVDKLFVMHAKDTNNPAPICDARWLSIGKTHLQQGIMALCRAVAQPDGF